MHASEDLSNWTFKRMRLDLSAQELFEDEGNLIVLFKIFWRLPLIFIATIIVRGVTIMLFNPLFKLAKSGQLQQVLATLHRTRASEQGPLR